MGERLRVPPELEHLIEKRETDDERRQGERRTADLGPLGAIETARDLDDVPSEERRSGTDRRQAYERRKKPVRDSKKND